jgi:nucleoside-diphosphate kinase
LPFSFLIEKVNSLFTFFNKLLRNICLTCSHSIFNILIHKKMAFQQTLVMIKPDAYNRKITGQILSAYEQRGLQILQLKTVRTTDELIREHYDEHKDSPTFEDLVSSMVNQLVQVIIIEGYDAISRVRSINGATDPLKAGPDTIRGKYGSCIRYNSVHASDSIESAHREIKLWFGL